MNFLYRLNLLDYWDVCFLLGLLIELIDQWTVRFPELIEFIKSPCLLIACIYMNLWDYSRAESLNRDLGKASEWCDLWGMKLNASKTKTMVVCRSRTMHPQSPPLTTGRSVLKESDEFDIFGVTFNCKMTFEKHLRSVSWSASQRLGILRKSWCIFHDRLLLGRCIRVLSCPFCSAVLQCGARLLIHALYYWAVYSVFF